ncbi:conserved hypothetical protein, partial [Ricinus communis]
MYNGEEPVAIPLIQHGRPDSPFFRILGWTADTPKRRLPSASGFAAPRSVLRRIAECSIERLPRQLVGVECGKFTVKCR